MTTSSETIDRRDRAYADAEALPKPNVWMKTNLSWNPIFWKQLPALRLMRLNPHWHIEKKQSSTYPIEDVLLERQFEATPEMECNDSTYTAYFPEIGVRLFARSGDKGKNTDLSFSVETNVTTALSVEEAARTMQYWLPSIREYYRLYECNSFKHRCWRFFMDKVMLTMNPTQRRISGFMFKLTVLECLLILILGVGWFYYGA